MNSFTNTSLVSEPSTERMYQDETSDFIRALLEEKGLCRAPIVVDNAKTSKRKRTNRRRSDLRRSASERPASRWGLCNGDLGLVKPCRVRSANPTPLSPTAISPIDARRTKGTRSSDTCLFSTTRNNRFDETNTRQSRQNHGWGDFDFRQGSPNEAAKTLKHKLLCPSLFDNNPVTPSKSTGKTKGKIGREDMFDHLIGSPTSVMDAPR